MNEFNISNLRINFIKSHGLFGKNEGVCHKKILDCLSVVQAVEGSYDIRLNNGKVYSTGEGGVFIAPSSALQEITHHDGKSGVMKAHWVFIDAVVNDLFRFDEAFSFPVISAPRYNEEIHDIISTIRFSDNYFQKMQLSYRLLEILFSQATKRKKPSTIESKLEDFVKNNYRYDIKAEDIARHLACSSSQIYKYTKKFYGLSPANYINGIRLQQAETRLLYSDANITEIASSVGFSDSAYFSKLFKKAYAYSPIEYRRLFAQK